MRDGLYRVVAARYVAGFVVEGGRVTRCAPILRRHCEYLLSIGAACWIGP